jgi:hypothetical protein
VSLYGLALLALWQAGIAPAWKIGLLLWLIVTLFFTWPGMREAENVVIREQIGRWWIESATFHGAAELTSFNVWHFLVVMRFKGWDAQGKLRYRQFVIWSDAVDTDTFRRLRVRLRYGLRLIGNDDEF